MLIYQKRLTQNTSKQRTVSHQTMNASKSNSSSISSVKQDLSKNPSGQIVKPPNNILIQAMSKKQLHSQYKLPSRVIAPTIQAKQLTSFDEQLRTKSATNYGGDETTKGGTISENQNKTVHISENTPQRLKDKPKLAGNGVARARMYHSSRSRSMNESNPQTLCNESEDINANQKGKTNQKLKKHGSLLVKSVKFKNKKARKSTAKPSAINMMAGSRYFENSQTQQAMQGISFNQMSVKKRPQSSIFTSMALVKAKDKPRVALN